MIAITISNYEDIVSANRSLRSGAVRQTDVLAEVDESTVHLCLRQSVIRELGLRSFVAIPGDSKRGLPPQIRYGPVQFEVNGRDDICDVVEVPDTESNILGRIPLILLDWVVEPLTGNLIGNPAHGGERMYDI